MFLFVSGACCTDSRPCFQKRNGQIEGDFRARVQKAVVADLHEAGRKDVLEEAADELECCGWLFLRLGSGRSSLASRAHKG